MRLTRYFQTKLALGGDITIEIVSQDDAAAVDTLFADLWRVVFSFERSFSRFIPKSELTQLNRLAGLRFEITTEFENLLRTAKGLSQQTGGLYNPFILPALQQAGYRRSAVPGYENDAVDDYSRRRMATIDELKIGKNWAEIPTNTALDIGGCGKGYLADKLSEMLISLGENNFRLSLGGDIATCGADENGNNWLINIQDANNLSGSLEQMIKCPVERFAIATSGTFRRKTQAAGWDWHHIIDPISLRPANTDIRLATVCSGSAVEADVLASCAVIVGSVKALAFLREHNASSALLQAQNNDGVFVKRFGHDIIRKLTKEGK